MVKFALFFIIIFIGIRCTPIEYKADTYFLNSGLANKPEYFARINKAPCTDLNGLVGLCTFAIKGSESVKVTLPLRPYGYELHFRCGNSNGIFYKKNIQVLPNSNNVVISLPELTGKRLVHCIGDVFPDDRNKPIYAFFEMYIRIIDDKYVPLEEAYPTFYKGKKYFLMSKYAKYATIKTNKYTYHLKKQPYFKYKTTIKEAIVESENLRFYYYKNK